RYPPLFSLLLAAVPEALLRRTRVLVAPLLDTAQLALLLAAARALGLSPAQVIAAGAVYAVTPTLAHEHATLNPRSLASLLVTATLLLAWHAEQGSNAALLGAVGAGALALLANKMAAQVLVLALMVEAAHAPAVAAAVAVGAPLAALAASGG